MHSALKKDSTLCTKGRKKYVRPKSFDLNTRVGIG
jgi:hypothetical protein